MIESAYNSKRKLPPPRTPEIVTAFQKGYGKDLSWPPWVQYQKYGVELRWTEKYTATISNNLGRAVVEFDFGLPPFPPEHERPEVVTRDGYYSIGVEHELIFPKGFLGLVLPIPRFYEIIPENAYNDVPAILPSVYELDTKPAMLYVVAKLPAAGTEHIFYKGEPFCQIIPIPRGDVTFRPMDQIEQAKHGQVPGGSATAIPESESRAA